MPFMRAKMRVEKVVSWSPAGVGETLTFRAVGRNGSYPQGGADEDNTFAKFTPNAELTMSLNNPDLVGRIRKGDTFYVDFSPVTP